MRLGTSYKQHGIPSPGPKGWDAVVIGSGIGGLACASLLARHQHARVLVLERHYTAGGFTHVFQRPGYEWDVGVHYIGDVHRPGSLLRRLFDHLTDGALAWEDMGEVYDQVVIGADTYDFVRGRENLRRKLHGYFPSQRDVVDRYLDAVRATVGTSRSFFMEKALPPAVAKVAGVPLRWRGLREARRTVKQVLDSLGADPRLQGVLTAQYGDYGLPPGQASWFMHALLVAHYLNGAAYPVGGSGRIAETILPTIRAEGGAVVTSAEVERVVVENGRAVGVRLAGGEEVRARSVISDAGVALTFGKLVGPEDALRAGVRVPTEIGASAAHVTLYVGLKRSAKELGLARANQWIYPDHDHDRNVARYLADPEAPLPLAYLSFPSAKDPDFERRHPGHATMEVIGLAPWGWFSKWEGSTWKKRGADYDALKARLADRLREVMLRRCPQVAEAVDHVELSTPLSTQHFAGHPQGELYGLAHSPARFASRELRPQTKLDGLFLTGADVCTAGVGGAVMGGVLTAAAVARKNLLGSILAGSQRSRAAPVEEPERGESASA